jgi:hypothetical protein
VQQFSLKGYAIYSELSTLVHILVGAVFVFLIARLKGKGGKIKIAVQGPCQCRKRLGRCAVTNCSRAPRDGCDDGFCDDHCRYRSS